MPLKTLRPSMKAPLTLPASVVASGAGGAVSAHAIALDLRAIEAAAIPE